jgi:anti-sigma28 factor (negative regulator of flagellin synthesis)
MQTPSVFPQNNSASPGSIPGSGSIGKNPAVSDSDNDIDSASGSDKDSKSASLDKLKKQIASGTYVIDAGFLAQHLMGAHIVP